MYKPSRHSLVSLIILSLVSVLVYWWAQTSYVDIPWQQEKLDAAQLMSRCMGTLKAEILSRGISINKKNDPAATGLIGPSFSRITTSPGILEERQTALNPNLAAVVIDRLKKAELKEGDYVAVAVSGTNPGANLAVYAAIQTLKLKPVIITSVGSSQYGASRPEFTWLDMEDVLYKNGLISFKSTLASLGGGSDTGRGLTPEGRQLLQDAITRNNITLLEDSNMETNVQARIAFYQKSASGSSIKMFVNVGATLPNTGNLVIARMLYTGPSLSVPHADEDQNSVLYAFTNQGVPYLNLFRLRQMAERKEYRLPIAPQELPAPGTGGVFTPTKNDVRITAAALAILIATMILVIRYDRRKRHFSQNIIDFDQEL